MEVGTLTPDTRIENEECVYCFNDYDSAEGINICLKCFRCVCCDHAKEHFVENGHSMFLSRKRNTIITENDPSKLAIGVDGGFQDARYTFDNEIRMFHNEGYEVLPIEIFDDETAIDVVNKIKAMPSISTTTAVESWELSIVECPHVKSITSPTEKVEAPTMKCKCCDLEKNLWVCLQCGHVGCARKNFDGSGGNNHALEHFRATGHAVCAKLGTITPDGRADIFCYACDETVHDSKLAEHLKGISYDIQQSVKTESTTTELCVTLNKNWDFEAVTADGKEYEKMRGPMSVGLTNLGNTCYMNSVLQLLGSLPSFVNECTTENAKKSRWSDPKLQFYRLYIEMMKGERMTISPRILRSVVCHDNREFMSGHQQDAVEFFLYLFNYIKIHNPNTCLTNCEFDSVDVLTCSHCKSVATNPMKDLSLLLLTPPKNFDNEKEMVISFEELLNFTHKRVIPERQCDKCGKCGCESDQQMKNFPDYLFVGVTLDSCDERGVVRKENVSVSFDINNVDITTRKCAVEETVDEKKVLELMNLGFSRSQCVRALRNVSDVEQAITWIIENPMEASPAVQQVMEMGFTEEEAREALEESSGNVGLAIEWLFGPRTKKKISKKSDGNGTYELVGFLQHKGPSALCGHYVATIKRNDKWVLYNDGKVSIYPNDVQPAFGKGYLYLFKRKTN